VKTTQFVACEKFPCTDVKHDRYNVPAIEIDPLKVRIVLISEAAADDPTDNYYVGQQALFARTTLLAFNDAGYSVESIQDILDLGVYLTTAVKCGKTGYAIQGNTIETCSHLLETELGLFPNVETYLLMGDVAIKAVNTIAKRLGQPRVVPAGSTYKIRGGSFTFQGRRALPSYTQAGPSFFIEKSKRKMIAEDIALALK
jgi:uracil-DNA glycosylase